MNPTKWTLSAITTWRFIAEYNNYRRNSIGENWRRGLYNVRMYPGFIDVDTLKRAITAITPYMMTKRPDGHSIWQYLIFFFQLKITNSLTGCFQLLFLTQICGRRRGYHSSLKSVWQGQDFCPVTSRYWTVTSSRKHFWTGQMCFLHRHYRKCFIRQYLWLLVKSIVILVKPTKYFELQMTKIMKMSY